jgi:hypothetical protein
MGSKDYTKFQTVIAGLVPAIPIRLLRDFRKEITPLCIVLPDEARLPGTGPVLHVLLTLDRIIIES